MINDNREFYEHEVGCEKEHLSPATIDPELNACVNCGGIFRPDGTGIAYTDLRFDEGRVTPEITDNIVQGEE